MSWLKLERQIRSACNRGQTQTDFNLQVSKVLFDAARDRGWSAVQEPMGSLSVGFGESVRYWNDVVIADTDGPFIPFFDHRRRGGLTTPATRHIVFSMQHIGVRERNPDLGEVRLAVVRFPVVDDARRVQVYFHDGSDLLTYEELDTRGLTVVRDLGTGLLLTGHLRRFRGRYCLKRLTRRCRILVQLREAKRRSNPLP